MTTTTRGSTLTMIAVGAGVSSAGGFALLLCSAGVLTGASLIFAGVRMADDDAAAPMSRFAGVLAGAAGLRALVHRRRRKLAPAAGLLLTLMSSASAVGATTADREAAPVLWFCAFVLLQLAISLINIAFVLGEQEQN